ncbi:MAG TPA: hypothetical protein VHN39_02830, partial [Phenylobacterium sp.]|nr:hypothetical protein [Phenylobacterium sp.]
GIEADRRDAHGKAHSSARPAFEVCSNRVAGAQSRGAGLPCGLQGCSAALAVMELWKMGRALSRGEGDGERRFG